MYYLTGYIKYFVNGAKNMSFAIKDDMCLNKYNEVWDKMKNTLNIKFHSMLVYDEKYIKAKVREVNGVIKTNFLSDEVPKENEHYTCIACITIDSVMRMEKKNYPQVYLEEYKYIIKKDKDDQIHRSWTKIRVRVRVRIWLLVVIISSYY